VRLDSLLEQLVVRQEPVERAWGKLGERLIGRREDGTEERQF
jgi:hypothetical protein